MKRPPAIDGLPLDEFIRRNADPIWLHQNEMWELMGDDSEGPMFQSGQGGDGRDV